MFLVLVTIFNFSLSSCDNKKNISVITYSDEYSPYSSIVRDILPQYSHEQKQVKTYSMLETGSIVEAFGTQAIGALETGRSKYWYPQYLATVVIAVDRDKTDFKIRQWKDLFDCDEEVSYLNSEADLNDRFLLAAISYGLEGDNYSLEKAILLLKKLKENELLKINSYDSPITICYDYNAINLIKKGKNIDIIIPRDGTLTYEKGLLSNENLTFKKNIDESIIKNGLRPLNSKSPFYNKDYSNAKRITDFVQFAKTTKNATLRLNREVLGQKLYVSIGLFENLIYALVYMCIVGIWMGRILRRSTNKGTNYATIASSIILNGWVILRLMKYQVLNNSDISRYLWYSYYIFQLSLPLVSLWLAWSINKADNEISLPKWWKAITGYMFFLLIMVMTNDLHNQVFKINLNSPKWESEYSYGIVFFIIVISYTSMISLSYFILMKKSIEIPRKKAFILPFLNYIVYAAYSIMYIIRVPLIYSTDVTIITGFFVMLMFESGIYSGLIPVNTKHVGIFEKSPLKMQIVNKDYEVVISSITTEELDKKTIKKAISSSPILKDNNTLLFANPIAGGYTMWCEDISKIQELYRKNKDTSKKLIEANQILAEEARVKREFNEKKAKRSLMNQLEKEISGNTKRLSKMIDELEFSDKKKENIAKIALLVCYLKRKCELFFKERSVNETLTTDLIMYMDELREIAEYSNVQIVISEKIEDTLPIRQLTLFYDFCYTMVELAIKKSCPYLIINLEKVGDILVMQILPSIELGELKREVGLINAIENANGTITRKKIEDSIGISISFKGV